MEVINQRPRVVKRENWSLSLGKDVRIRRWVYFADKTKTQESHPKKNFKEVINDPEALEAYVAVLNHRDIEKEKAQSKFKINHAFISSEDLQNFYTHLRGRFPSEEVTWTHFKLFRDNALNFFQTHVGPDFIEWYKNQDMWGHSLLSQDNKLFDRLMSESTIRKTIKTFNWFFKFMNMKNPELFSPLKFQPITKQRLKYHEENRKLLLEKTGENFGKPPGKYIPQKHIDIILKEAPENIKLKLPYQRYILILIEHQQLLKDDRLA